MPDTPTYALASIFGPGRDEMVAHVPHAAALGMKVIETGPKFAVLMLPYQEHLVGDPVRKVIFGGVITTLIDQACGIAVACSLDNLRAIATVDLRVDYLRAAEPGCDLYARAECYRVARSVAFVRVVAYEREIDDPFASCLGTFMLGAHAFGSAFDRAVEAPIQGGES